MLLQGGGGCHVGALIPEGWAADKIVTQDYCARSLRDLGGFLAFLERGACGMAGMLSAARNAASRRLAASKGGY